MGKWKDASDEKDAFSFVSSASIMLEQLNGGDAYQNFMLGPGIFHLQLSTTCVILAWQDSGVYMNGSAISMTKQIYQKRKGGKGKQLCVISRILPCL